MLRIEALYDTEERQRLELQSANAGLAERVARQVSELQRIGRLKRFLAPQIADLIASQSDEQALEYHRREIVVVFCDLRGFTSFAETAEPEEVMGVLKQYLEALGPLVHRHEGTLTRFTGDGIMALFNDPLPCPPPADPAARLAIEIRAAAAALAAHWRKLGHQIGFGVGIAQGYATLGQIGFEDRMDYKAIGTAGTLPARLRDCVRAWPV